MLEIRSNYPWYRTITIPSKVAAKQQEALAEDEDLLKAEEALETANL